MDSLRLRKMSYKYKFDFGKYHGLTVQELLNLKHTRYLRWCYYNLDKISYVEEILVFLGIVEDYVIDKPGKDPDKFNVINEEKSKKMGFKEVSRELKRKKLRINAVDTKTRIRSKRLNKKETLRSKNQLK